MSKRDQPDLDNSSSRGMRVFESACLMTAVGLIVVHIVRLVGSPDIALWPTVFAVALGLPMADFLSGLIHWAGDTWGKVSTPCVGPRFLVPFRYHHLYPHDMLRSPFVTTNGDSALVSCLVLGAAFLLSLVGGGLAAVFLAAVGAWGLPTSQIHKWAHDPCPPRVITWLQRTGLILSPEHHWRHHRSAFECHYCITTGWCNPLLEKMRFWKGLEWIVSRLTGLKPRDDVDLNGIEGTRRL